ncbi:hypothetical protein EJB05_33637, partial [Eragrostis curvula]
MDGFAGHRNGEAATAVPALDDVVTFKKKKKSSHGKRGLVVPDRRLGPSQDDKLAVMCVDGAILYEDAGDLTVVDRSYLRTGKFVVSASDLGGKIGVVTKATTSLDLVRLVAGEPVVVARDVSPAELRRVREFSVGHYVVSGPWLGRVVEVSVNVDVQIGDGFVCRVSEADERKLEVIGGGNGRQVTNIFVYPGQRVKSTPRLNGSFKGTVSNVEVGAVLVHWVASAALGTNPDLIKASAPPAYQQNLNDLTLFASSGDCFWGVGDRCFFRNAESPPPLKKALFNLGRRREATGHNLRPPMQVEEPMSVADTRTTVDVLWQDGTQWCDVPSASLVPVDIDSLNNYEFFPREHVISKVTDGAEISGTTAEEDLTADAPLVRYGIVRSVDVGDQTVRVSWFEVMEHGGKVESNETVSAYDLALVDHKGQVFYGDIVVRLQPLETAVGANDLSWVGHVIDLCDDGCVQVKWGDKTTSKALPHEISVVHGKTISEMENEMGDWMANDAIIEAREDKDEDHAVAPKVLPHKISVVGEQTISEMEEGMGDWVAIDAVKDAQDTDENHAMDATGNVTAEIRGNDDDAADVSGGEAGTPGVSGLTQGLMRLAAEVTAKGKRFFVCDPEATARLEPAAMENVVNQSNGGSSETMVVEEEVDNNICAKQKSSGNALGDALFHIPQFDVVEKSPPDHYFLKETEQGIGGGREWIKTVQKEWKILENNLPDTIYVRALEDRADLLRVAMVGAVGTPYQDGLFFFDLQLPPTYPNVPPRVHYHSFGLRLNPNLDNSGTVCISLLDTCDGEDMELWSPEMSTILQVVVSIQGLVLTAQPFYNESENDQYLGTPEAARNEVIYAEETCLLALRTMLHLLRRPPAGFEELVRRHFRRRGRFVLRACEAYLREACPVGMLDEEANTTEVSSGRTCSAGFRLVVARFMPQLIESFTAIDANGYHQFDKFLV